MRRYTGEGGKGRSSTLLHPSPPFSNLLQEEKDKEGKEEKEEKEEKKEKKRKSRMGLGGRAPLTPSASALIF